MTRVAIPLLGLPKRTSPCLFANPRALRTDAQADVGVDAFASGFRAGVDVLLKGVFRGFLRRRRSFGQFVEFICARARRLALERSGPLDDERFEEGVRRV